MFVELNLRFGFVSYQGAKEALDLGISGPEGIEISRPEEVILEQISFLYVLQMLLYLKR